MAFGLPDAAGQLQSLLASDAQALTSSFRRVPMSFTSLRRTVDLGTAAEGFAALRQTNPGVTSFSPRTGSNRLQRIKMAVNPSSIRFAQQKKISRADGVGGTDFQHFTNEDGEDDDVLVVSFTGTTGNIDVLGALSSPDRDPNALLSGTAIDQALHEDDVKALEKLRVWHELFALTHEPARVRYSGVTYANQMKIVYVSKLFPLPLTLLGFWSKPLEWEETAALRASRQYTMEFTVEDTLPSLGAYLDQLLTTIDLLRMNPAGAAARLGLALRGT